MSFLFPDVHCSAPGRDSRWMPLSSSLAYRCLSLSSIQIPAFLCQITCLPLLTSIFLPIAIHCGLRLPLCFALLCSCGALFPFLYLPYPLQAAYPAPAISPRYDCSAAFIEDCISLHCSVCHFATSVLFQKSITHQIKQ